MQKVLAALRRVNPPLAFLVLLILSFGLLIPWLGFYWDDWPIVLAARLQGVDAFWDYYRQERPFSAWSYVYSIPFLGTKPLTWHITTLLLRWLTVVGMWWSLNLVWPRQPRQILWSALLFAIYPIFTDQPVALAFSQHWICFSLYFLSLGLMLTAVRRQRRAWLLHGFALAAMLVNLLTMEYIWGLELLRPVFLWIVFTETIPDRKARLRKTLKVWLPYLVTFIGVIVWRMAFAGQLSEGNRPEVLYALVGAPLQTIASLFQVVTQDMIHNLIGAWYTTMNPAEIEFVGRIALLSAALALVTGGLAYGYMRLKSDAESEADSREDQRQWLRQAVVVGLLGVLAGSAPVWLIERQSLVGLHSGRFALAGMFGLSILIVAALEWFTPRRTPKILLLAILIGLAAGFHLRNAVSYYRSTLLQNQFSWQLAWRAPYIQPNTAILSADELFVYVGRKPTAVTLNLLYPQPQGIRRVGYWFLELYHDVGYLVVPKLARGRTLSGSFRTFDFEGSSLDSLVIYYKPGAGRCLWVLSPLDADNPELPELTRQALPVSNLGRIVPEPVAGDYPPDNLFGKEPVHDWCYYYQKAELARQLEDWQGIVRLAQQAEESGYQATNQHERLVFIEGFARAGEWEKAITQTLDTYNKNVETAPRLCNLWDRVASQAVPPQNIESPLADLREQLQCGSLP